MSKYERIGMMRRQTIQEMLTRFTNIINEFISLGNDILVDEQLGKF